MTGSTTPRVTPQAIRAATNAARLAAWDSLYRADAIPGHPIFDATYAEGMLKPQEMPVERVELFDRVYSGTPDDVGTIELTYHRRGYRALYGFTADGRVSLYAD